MNLNKRTRLHQRDNVSGTESNFALLTRGEKITLTIVFIIFLLYALSLIYPFIYLLINSFKSGVEFGDNPFGFPQQWLFSNYLDVFRDLNLGSMFLNSILLSLGETLVSMVMTCCAAYVLAKYTFVGNKFIYTLVLVTSIVPTIGSLPAVYKLMNMNIAGINGLTLSGTYLGMILLQCGAFGGTFLFIHSYFKAIPWSFAESAMVDGASDFRIFWQIMVPLARNGILTFTIIRFLGFWNDYWMPSLFYSNRPTLAVGLAELSADQNYFHYPVIFAAMIVSIVPVLIFYAIFQKHLMINTIGGGLKE